jgi:hypothetical protein
MNKQQDRHYANYRQAAGMLLDDNLVWSADMDSIRVHLGNYINRMASIGDFTDFNIFCLVQDLISSENDLSI